jgi:hypothetical protein
MNSQLMDHVTPSLLANHNQLKKQGMIPVQNGNSRRTFQNGSYGSHTFMLSPCLDRWIMVSWFMNVVVLLYTSRNIGEISGFDCDEYEDGCLLRYWSR